MYRNPTVMLNSFVGLRETKESFPDNPETIKTPNPIVNSQHCVRIAMMKSLRYLPIVLILLWPSNAFSGILGPSNYWECILDEMPGVKNDPAAIEVIKKCRNEFPNSSNDMEKKSPIIGVKTAGECVRDYGKEVSSPMGAKAVQIACYRLYPRK